MISSLRGVVVSIGSHVVLEVGGVGYALDVTVSHRAALVIGAETTILTLMIVRPESMTIYGFASAGDLALFSLLTAVNGVGPRSAMAALGAIPADAMALAIEQDNAAAFRKVAGIGPKTAQLIVMSLRGKVRSMLPESVDATDIPAPLTPVDVPARTETVKALVALGWNQRTAATAIDNALVAAPGGGSDLSVPALLRMALAQLGPNQTAR
ncbi:Holliday junction branch migration protein RuvA [Cryobacterium zongtaii]|uniref:Holliday junction branch migration complex subunit RuvA n=1 Tax=Cryobacterium zongtaii TaxID=1259217 RepID=A0A2S3ZPV3_9MICO|nr:Holliday junction branch migration protein RuvA [Cryobacterium zongtaii]POH71241.1 Holliday junction branch migration protein RuvA [Cryobacterium zongtaii]